MRETNQGSSKAYADRVKMIKADDKRTFASAVERNGRMVRDHVLVRGRDEHHPEARYYLDWYEHGRKRRQADPSFEELVAAFHM